MKYKKSIATLILLVGIGASFFLGHEIATAASDSAILSSILQLFVIPQGNGTSVIDFNILWKQLLFSGDTNYDCQLSSGERTTLMNAIGISTGGQILTQAIVGFGNINASGAKALVNQYKSSLALILGQTNPAAVLYPAPFFNSTDNTCAYLQLSIKDHTTGQDVNLTGGSLSIIPTQNAQGNSFSTNSLGGQTILIPAPPSPSRPNIPYVFPAGPVLISITAPGYVPDQVPVNLVNGFNVESVYLIPIPITFEITDPTKPAGANGIVGAYISITGGNLPYATNIATNANAAATTSTLTLGQTYNVTVTKPGYVTLNTTAGINTIGQVVKWSLTPIKVTFETPNTANAAAGVVGATITIKNTTGDPITIPAPITLTTNSSAAATYSAFPPGIYTITASAPGFQTVTQGPDYVTYAAGQTGKVLSLPMTPIPKASAINVDFPSVLPNCSTIQTQSPEDAEAGGACEIGESCGSGFPECAFVDSNEDDVDMSSLIPDDLYDVTVSAPGYNTESGTITTTNGTATLNLPALTPATDIIYGTSEDVNGNPITTSGVSDPHWTTTDGQAITYDNESYTGDSTVLNGIGPTDAAFNNIGFPESGEYSYTTTFNLTQSEISSISLQFVVSPNCNTDANCIADVVLNGYSSADEIWVPSGNGYKFIFGPTSEFVVGKNTLTIDVQYNEENDPGYYDQNDAPSAMTTVKFSNCSGIVCR